MEANSLAVGHQAEIIYVRWFKLGACVKWVDIFNLLCVIFGDFDLSPFGTMGDPVDFRLAPAGAAVAVAAKAAPVAPALVCLVVSFGWWTRDSLSRSGIVADARKLPLDYSLVCIKWRASGHGHIDAELAACNSLD